MNDNEQPPIIVVEVPTPKNHFPIVAQLGILSLVLVGIFGTLFFVSTNNSDVAKVDELPAPVIVAEIAPIVPEKIDSISLVAKAAYVWDANGQRALYAKNADAELPLASITKLMTALLSYELIEQNEKATVSESAIEQEGSSGLVPGEKLSVREVSELALVSSSNDAAYVLAASVGQLLGDDEPTAQFVRGMNIRAEELGLASLHFKNMTGLDLSATEPGAVGNARDISFLMEYIITNYPDILEPTKRSETRVYNSAGAFHDIDNTNEITAEIPNLIGSKTGFTDLAGGNLTIAFDAGLNRPIIITVLGSTREDRFNDVLKLVDAVQKSVGGAN